MTMMKRLATLVIVALLLGVTAGCRTSPIRDVTNAPVPYPPASYTQMERAIVAAGAGLGWRIERQSRGVMIGTLYLRDHMAKVKIRYNSRRYSIRYLDSSNLQYNPRDRSIHSNYNSWVQNLDNAIRSQLSIRN